MEIRQIQDELKLRGRGEGRGHYFVSDIIISSCGELNNKSLAITNTVIVKSWSGVSL